MRRRFAAGVVVLLASACGTPTTPPPPPPPDPGPATAPIIRAISVPTSRVEAGQDVAITATVDDAETPLTQLAYQWSASAGTITGSGTVATWTMPRGITAGVNITITLTVVDTYNALVNNQIVQRQFTVVGTSSAFRVHDSEAETKELARKFLIDLFGNSSISPEDCLVDFTTVGRCARGRQLELEDIVENRKKVVINSARIRSQSVTIFSPQEAVVVSFAEFVDTVIATGASGHALGDFTLTAVYDRDRWWLCESTFLPSQGYGGFYELYTHRNRGRVPKR